MPQSSPSFAQQLPHEGGHGPTKSINSSQHLPDFGPRSVSFGRFGPAFFKSLPELGICLQDSAKHRPRSADVGRVWDADVDHVWPEFDCLHSGLPRIGQVWRSVCPRRPTLFRSWPNVETEMARMSLTWAHVGQDWLNSGRSSAPGATFELQRAASSMRGK